MEGKRGKEVVMLWAGQSGRALRAGPRTGAEGVAEIITKRPCESQLLPWLVRSFVSVSHSFHILKWDDKRNSSNFPLKVEREHG